VFEGRSLERQARFLEFHPRIDNSVYNHSIVTMDWRLTLYPNCEDGWGELFDLKDDPGEHRNLFNDTKHRKIRDHLAEQLTLNFPARQEAGTELIAKW
jgi:hypothetical protein